MIKGIVKHFFLALIMVFSLLSSITQADTSLPARFSADGYASTDYLVGQADWMLPLKSNAGHNLYIDPALAIGNDSQGFVDLGLGYRWLKNNAVILGGYLFGGYTRIDNNARLWVMNPGIEALSSRWDAHLNGYVVMGDRNQNVSNFLIFDEFSGHSEFFYLFNVIQHAGDGVDAKLGYLFPGTPLKAYVGSYFFSPAQTNNVLGGAAGLEYWVGQHTKVFANYTYDNLRRSVGAIGIGVELGGVHAHRIDPSVEERITDPVERYLAELGRGSAIPSRKNNQFAGVVDPSTPGGRDNIAFFSLTGGPNNGGMGLTLNDCTFENPCGPTDLTNQGAQTLANLLPNTQIFFAGGPGAYSALNVLGGVNPVTIIAGQSINALSAGAPPTFNGGFILPGNNSLNNIILLPTTSTATGAGVSATGNNIAINDSQIGSTSNPFATGLDLSGDTVANLVSSRISASDTGINMQDTAGLTSNASTIAVNGGNILTGINSASTGPINLTGGAVNVNGGTGLSGINSTGTGPINLTGGAVNVNGGSNLIGINSSTGPLSLTEGTIVSVTGTDTLFGIQPRGNFLLDDSEINVTGTDFVRGVETSGLGTATVTNASSINVNASGIGSRGFFDNATGVVNFNGGSSINVDANGTNAFGYNGLGNHPVNFSEGSSINVTSTASTPVGYFYQGSGPVSFSEGSAINVNAAGQNTVVGFADAPVASGDITFDASNINVTGAVGTLGLGSSGTGNLNIINNSTINVTGSDDSNGIDIPGNRTINFLDSHLIFNGGNASIGFNIIGSGNTLINNGVFDFTEGDPSSGFIFGGGESVSIENSEHNFTGGENFIGVKTQDTASVTVTESIFNVMAGDNSYIYEIGGSGPITIGAGSTLIIDASSGNSAGGIHLLPGSLSPLTISDSDFLVIGDNTARGIFAEGLGKVSVTDSQFRVNAIDAIGVDVLGVGVVDFVEGNLIDVNGAGNLYGIRAADGLSITGNDLNLRVVGDSASTAIGLATLNTGEITLSGIDMDITGGPSSAIKQELGGLITLNGINVCLLNGSVVAC